MTPEGRISPQDTGLWNDEQRDAWARIVDFVHTQDAAIGVQLAHAGRKASTYRGFPGEPQGSVPPDAGGWTTVGPSAEAFVGYTEPVELSHGGDLRGGGRLRRVRPARGRGRLRRGGDPRRPRLPDPPVPEPALQPPHRRATAATSPAGPGSRSRWPTRCGPPGRRRSRCSCGSPPPTGPTAAGTPTSRCDSPPRWGAGRRPGRHLHRRERAGRDPGRAGLPGAVRAPDPRAGRRSRPARSDSSWSRSRPRRSWPTATPTSCCWRGRPCGSRPGRSGPPPSWVCPGAMPRIRPRTCVAAGTTYRLCDRLRAADRRGRPLVVARIAC